MEFWQVSPVFHSIFRHEKKVLALVLAFACAFTMFAGAASFTDEADIQALDAVNMLTTLGVIQGYEDNSFQPDGVVTRAEMAKMIFVVRNNSADDEAYADITTNLTDINGHWAEGYIKFCESQGIIAGYGDGTFRPDATVTGTEAAKMLLVLTGYDEVNAGLTGTAWATNTLRHAGAAGILDNVSASLSAGLPRQWAAQMIYNTLSADRVKWSTDSGTFDDVLNGGIKETVGYAYMGLTQSVGTLISVDMDKLEISMNNSDAQDSDPVSAVWSSGWVYTYAENFSKVTTDYSDLLGQKVKVLFKDGKTNSVLGVTAMAGNEIITAVANQVEKDNAKIKIDGTSYTLDNGTTGEISAYINPVSGVQASADWTSDDFDARNLKQDASTMTFIDSDGNGRLDAVIVDEYNVAKVSYVGSSSIIAGTETYDFADENIAEGIARDDWAVISYNRFDGCKDIEVIEPITGSLTNLKTDKNADKGEFYQYMVGGEWYNAADLTDGTDVNYANADLNTVRAGDNVEAIVFNGVMFMVKRTSDGNAYPTDVALVVSKDDTTLAGRQMKLRFFNGDDAIVDFDTDSAHLAWNEVNEGDVYAYDISNGDYMMSQMVTTADYYNGFTWQNVTDAAFNNEDAINGVKIADDAKIILWDNNPKDSKVITGKQFISTLGTASMPTAELIDSFVGEMSGLNRVSAAAFQVDSIPSDLVTKDSYAYITSDASWVQTNSVITYTIWTGSENVTVREDHTRLSDRTKGTVIGYSTLSDIEGSDVKKISDVSFMNMTAEAVETVHDNQDTFTTYQGGDYEIDNSTTVLYVDSDASGDAIGQEAFDIQKAYQNAAGEYVANVLTNGNLEVLVVDIRNQIKNSPYLPNDEADVMGTVPTLGTIVTPTSIKDAEGTSVAGTTVAKNDVLTLAYTVANGNKVKVTLTGAVFSDEGTAYEGESEREVTGTGASITDKILVTGTSDEVSVTFTPMNVKIVTVADQDDYKVIPTAASAYNIKTRVNGSYVANNALVNINDKVEVLVEMTSAITAANTQTITISNNGKAIGSVEFNKMSKVGDVQTVSFTADGTDNIALTVAGSNAATTQAKIQSATMYDGMDTVTTTVANAKTIEVVFDKAMDKTTAETASSWNCSTGKVSTASLSADGLTLTLTVSTAFADGDAFSNYSAVKTADGADIATTSVTFNDGSSTATIVNP